VSRHLRQTGHGQGSGVWWAPTAAVAVLLGAGVVALGVPPADEDGITATRVAAGSMLRDAAASVWKTVPAVDVALLPQTVIAPTNPSPSVSTLRVQMAHDGEVLAVRLAWADASADVTTRSDEFGDQVAVQFPVRHDPDDLPNPMMGHAGAPVRILQWRSVLQHELMHGAPTLHDLYPNAVVDLSPDRILAGEVAAPYAGGRAAGNPVSRPRLLSPVVAHVAEGFGTLTAAHDQPADGRGTWEDGRWTVVITVAFDPREELPHRMRPGLDTMAAFAVWDGGNREVGGRKAWSSWMPLRITP
jgi:hypothetical protein